MITSRKDILDNPIAIFILFIAISLSNLLFSVHFVPIMFAGIVFIAFIKQIQYRYYYSLFWVVLTFIVIENTQGLKIFSLLLISIFIYIFIRSYLQTLISSNDAVQSLYIIIFYLLFMFVHIIFNGFDEAIISVIVVNIIVDSILVGLFI